MYSRVAIFLFLLFTSINNKLYCQYSEKQMKDDFLLGEEYISKYRYDAALTFFLRIYENDNQNANINFRIGQCYYNIYTERFKSIPYFELATKNVTKNYKAGDITNYAASIEVFYMLGDIYLKTKNYSKAYNNLIKYKEYLEEKDNEKLEKVEKKLQNVAIAYQMETAPLLIKEEVLPGINTRFSDYYPVLSKGETTLIYTSFWESADQIFMSRKKRGTWSVPVNITGEIASDGNCYATSLTNNGKTLYIIMRGLYNSDIYVSNLMGRKWDIMMPLNKKINSKNHEIDAFASFDGKILFFASDRKDGFGGYDIYKSVKKGNDWDKPVNLGNTVNTPYNEENPYLTPDNKYFIFSSEGHKSMGERDIFFCELKSDGTFSNPVNFGYPINTIENNESLVYFNETSTAYYSRDTKDDHRRTDIFKFTLEENTLADALTNNKESLTLDAINNDENYINNLKYIFNSNLTSTSSSITKFEESENQTPEVENNNFQSDTSFQSVVNTIADNNQEKFVEPEKIALLNTNEDFSTTPINDEIGYETASETELSPLLVSHPIIPSTTKHKDSFTVQIMALKHYRDPSYFSEFRNVRVFCGEDFIYRYVLDDYETPKKALEQYYKAVKLGYKDAFIRRTQSIPIN